MVFGKDTSYVQTLPCQWPFSPLWPLKCLWSPGSWLSMWKIPIRWGFWSPFAPHWAQTWTSVSCLTASGYQRNRRREYMRMWMRKEKEQRGQASFHARTGPGPNGTKNGECTCARTRDTVSESNHSKAVLFSVGSGSGSKCLFTSLPLVRAMASSLSLQVLKNKAHLIFPLVSQQTWREALLHQQCFGFQGHSGHGIADCKLCVI